MSGAVESPLAKLKDRDRKIVDLVVAGLQNCEIGDRLGMTEGNVKVTLHRIYRRLDVRNRVQLVTMMRDIADPRDVLITKLVATLKGCLPVNVCLTNRAVRDDTIVCLDAPMGDLRKIAAVIAEAEGRA